MKEILTEEICKLILFNTTQGEIRLRKSEFLSG